MTMLKWLNSWSWLSHYYFIIIIALLSCCCYIVIVLLLCYCCVMVIRSNVVVKLVLIINWACFWDVWWWLCTDSWMRLWNVIVWHSYIAIKLNVIDEDRIQTLLCNRHNKRMACMMMKLLQLTDRSCYYLLAFAFGTRLMFVVIWL